MADSKLSLRSLWSLKDYLASWIPFSAGQRICPKKRKHIWEEIIKNCEQIAEESLKKYRLNSVKENLSEDGLVRRYTFGKKDPTKRNKTILMVGETGSGKSTLINRMLNYMLGVKWEDGVRFEIIVDEGERPQTESQTDTVTAYEIFGLEELALPFSLTIIDTPGYGDTRGTEHDKLVAENLYKLLQSFSGVQQIDTACLVVKASQNRLSEKEKYIFDAVLSLFGKNMENNILTLITHSDWGPPLALDAISAARVPCAKNKKNTPLHFLFNNCPLKKSEEYEGVYKTGWENGEKSMHDFCQTLDKMSVQSLKETENVLKQRLRLEASIPSLVEQAQDTELKQRALEDMKKILEIHREDMENNKNIKIKHRVAVKKEEKTTSSATRCTVCKVNCHYPGCWWVSDLKWCSAMEDNYCTVCPGKCHYTTHVKGHKKYVQRFEESTESYEDLKKKLKIQTAEGVIHKLLLELKDVKAEKIKLLYNAYQCIVELKQCALKFMTNSTKQHIEYLIGKFKETEDTEKVQILEKML